MLCTREYDRNHAVEYARRWAYERNPLFENYTGIGGDCTNFVSQCIFAGTCVMNFTDTFGWYYISPSERAPAWTGVQYFYNFMTSNTGEGPFAEEVDAEEMQLGDVILLGNSEGVWYHAVIVTGFEPGSFLVAAHTNDAFNRRLDTYNYYMLRYLHILGARIEVEGLDACFYPLLEGRAIISDGQVIEERPDENENENGMPQPGRPGARTPNFSMQPIDRLRARQRMFEEEQPGDGATERGMQNGGMGSGTQQGGPAATPSSVQGRGISENDLPQTHIPVQITQQNGVTPRNIGMTQEQAAPDGITPDTSQGGTEPAPRNGMPQNGMMTTPGTDTQRNNLRTVPRTGVPQQGTAPDSGTGMQQNGTTTTPGTDVPQDSIITDPRTGMPRNGTAPAPDTGMPEGGTMPAPDMSMQQQGTSPVQRDGAQRNGLTATPRSGVPQNGMTTTPRSGVPQNGMTTIPRPGVPQSGIAPTPRSGVSRNGTTAAPGTGVPRNGTTTDPIRGTPREDATPSDENILQEICMPESEPDFFPEPFETEGDILNNDMPGNGTMTGPDTGTPENGAAPAPGTGMQRNGTAPPVIPEEDIPEVDERLEREMGPEPRSPGSRTAPIPPIRMQPPRQEIAQEEMQSPDADSQTVPESETPLGGLNLPTNPPPSIEPPGAGLTTGSDFGGGSNHRDIGVQQGKTSVYASRKTGVVIRGAGTKRTDDAVHVSTQTGDTAKASINAASDSVAEANTIADTSAGETAKPAGSANTAQVSARPEAAAKSGTVNRPTGEAVKTDSATGAAGKPKANATPAQTSAKPVGTTSVTGKGTAPIGEPVHASASPTVGTAKPVSAQGKAQTGKDTASASVSVKPADAVRTSKMSGLRDLENLKASGWSNRATRSR